MHYVVSHQTAAEIIYNRADSEKEHMGLTSWKHSPDGKILETDVIIAKNYLSKEELEDLERIVNAFLELDKLYQSDFDKLIIEAEKNKKNNKE